MPDQQVFTPAEFAAKIRAKYNAYQNVPDDQLTNRFLAKFPVYRSRVKTKFEQQNQMPKNLGFTPGHMAEQGWQGVKELAGGTYGLAKDVLSKQPLAETYQKDVVSPLAAEEGKAKEALKGGRYSEAAGHELASYIPFVGPWAASLGEQVGKGDIGGAVAKAGSQAVAAEATAKTVKSAAPYVKGVPEFIKQGKEGAAIKAANRLDGAMADVKPKLQVAVDNVKSEVGTHANAIATADEAASPQGSINIRKVADDARDSDLRQAATQMPRLDRALKQTDTIGQMPQVSWRAAQQLRSDIGGALSEAREAGKYREAGILSGMYSDMSDNLETRSTDLGMQESWTKYNQLNKRLRAMLDDGPIGKALYKDNGLQFFKTLDEPGAKGTLQAHLDSLKKYGFDPKDLASVKSEIKNSYNLAKGSEGSYMRYLTTRMGIGALLSAAGVPHGFMFGMAAGLIGPKYASILKELGTPMGRFEAPLESMRAGQSLQGPSLPPTPKPQPAPPTPQVKAPAGPSMRSSDIPQSPQVPLELQPSPGEQPIADMLRDIWSQTQTPEKQAELEKILQEELQKQGAKARVKSRTAEAVSEYRSPKAQARSKKPS